MEEDDEIGQRVALGIGLFIVGILVLSNLNIDEWWPRWEQREARPPTATSQPAPPAPPRPQPQELPPITAQYVATYVRAAMHGRPEQRVDVVHGSVWRRGSFAPADGGTNVEFSNLRTGVSVTWRRDAAGASEGMGASLRPSYEAMTYTHTNTGRTSSVLGERCTIWQADFLDERLRRPFSGWTTCVSDDGIRFWTRDRDYEGAERYTQRIVSLERRAVTEAESAPPARLFQWGAWRGDVGQEAPAHNLSIDYASPAPEGGGVPPDADSERVRERGGWRYVRTIDDDAHRRWIVTGPDVRFTYDESDFQGRRRNLSISRGPQREWPTPDYPLLQPPRSERIVGLRCRWFDMLAPSHHTAAACRTDDGLTLAHWSHGDGARGGNHSFDVRATRLSRDALPMSAVTPPAAAFEGWLD